MAGKSGQNQETYDLLGELARSSQGGRKSSTGSVRREGSSARTSWRASSSRSGRGPARKAPSVRVQTATTPRKRSRSGVADKLRLAALILIGVAIALFLIVSVAKVLGGFLFDSYIESVAESVAAEEAFEGEVPEGEEAAELMMASREEALRKASLLAAQYDYDSAIEALSGIDGYETDTEITGLIAGYEETKLTLVEQDVLTVPHIFFHILSVDPEISFDKSLWGTQADGYNSLMTTVDEFRAMLNQLYDKGFVLVSLHDLAHEEISDDGTVKMVRGSIKLPPGKKALVMSEDDVCYYEYMKGAGFSDLMVVGEDGKPLNRYTDSDGTVHYGAYDVATVLDEFLEEYPDFSYHGHKACLVFTGYNGVLGYRTDESYDPTSEYYDPSLEGGHDVEAEREEAVKVLRALYEDGYDLGSHSWGHRDLGTIEWDRFKKDCDRWERNVASLILEATGERPDIMIYPRGADVGDWHPYSSDNDRFNYLYELGFRYFCNVDNNEYWVQVGDIYMRQGRRALDGYNLWLEVSGQKNRMSDLFSDIPGLFDPARPTPVPSY